MKFNAVGTGGTFFRSGGFFRGSLPFGLASLAMIGAVTALALGVFTSADAQAAAPKTLYVSQTGLDSGKCTTTKPCATVSYALTKAAAGSIIYVSGTIDDNVTISDSVTITAWPSGPAGSFATLDGTGSGFGIDITSSGSAKLTDLTIENGKVPGSYIGQGAGITNDGVATLADSTVLNSCGTSNSEVYSVGTMSILDSTVTYTANTPEYACQAIVDASTVAAMRIFGSTISGNNLGLITGGTGESIVIGSSIVAGNLNYYGVVNDCNANGGLIKSVGYNLTDDSTDTACSFNVNTDKVNQDPDLGALASNGGPTQTMLPANTSPAVDVIPNPTTLSGAAVCPGTDQRGVSRPGSGETRCSIGSVEVGSTAPSTTSVTLIPTTVPSGTRVIFLVTVAPTSGSGTPTGKVTFATDKLTLCKATLSGGVAACGATTAPVGADVVKATYSGGGGFAGSSGTAKLTVTTP